MTPTPSDLLARHAPRDAEVLDPHLEDVLARVPVVGSAPRRRFGRRTVLLGAGVAAATVVAVALPVTSMSGRTDAAALGRLADTAGEQPGLVLTDGSYLHLVTVENPDGGFLVTASSPDVYPRTLESWSANDGTTWRHDREAGGAEQFWRFDPPASFGGSPDTSPRTLASLPTDPAALEEHLRPIVQGSSSTDEAVFVYLSDALRMGWAPPEVQRAMIATMARLPHIETGPSSTGDGRPCLRVEYSEPLRLGLGQYVCFDETTAALVEEGTTGGGVAPDFVSVVTERELVDSVPPDVLEGSEDPGA